MFRLEPLWKLPGNYCIGPVNDLLGEEFPDGQITVPFEEAVLI